MWDAFLLRMPLGQFQQSSLWAQTKVLDGWTPVRLRIELDGEVVGGWQVLHRDGRFGRIGYVSKGPVIPSDRPDLVRPAIESLLEAMAVLRIVAVTVQPPDDDAQLTDALPMWGFIRDPTDRVVQSTLVNDLSGGPEIVNAGIHKGMQQTIRQARKRGLTIRHGDDGDIPAFFDLMLSTCLRQKTRPNPPSVRALQEVWRLFTPKGQCRLMLAEFGSEPVAGLFCLAWGRTFTLWKKGWNGQHGDRRPNELLTHSALMFASTGGFEIADFAALTMDITKALIAGQPLSAEQASTRHLFNLKFGGRPKLLPPSQLLIRSTRLRAVARLAQRLWEPVLQRR